jgi:ATP-dependent helicase HepA
MKHATADFAPGQRWISETQTELGLGLVEGVEHRRVRMLFPATGERRTYAVHDAPLWRAQFGPGERIRDIEGRELVVTGTDTDTAGGLVTYHGQATDGRPLSMPEPSLDPHLRLNRPQQKLLAGRIDRDTWFDLRQRTWHARTRAAASKARGLIGPRISPIQHQLYIAAEVADRHAPRVLLADEVGLGKTIEAGLILHRMLLAGRAGRVLILVPETLLHQWLVELLRRFNLRFALFDSERFAASDGNPFQTEQRVLCSLDLLTSDPAIARAALGGDWDLLICDEAHHLHWTPTDSSLDYDLVAALAAETPAVLLLTATPEQLGRAGHFGRLRLLDPRRFSDYDTFLAEEADYAPVAEIAARLLDGEPLDEAQQQRLEGLLGDTADLSAEQIITRLLDRHGTGRILFRNTRAAISGFPTRQVHPAPLPVPASHGASYGETTPWPERDAGRGWTELDPRLPWLIDTLRQLRPQKVLLICAGADTVLDLRLALLEQAGIHAAMFHEGMEIIERDRAAAYFADPDEGTQVLLCSEIGSEGRNFQFAHHLVLFDLPLDPELLEQRIGRLDRIGQTRTIEIHVPYLAGTPGETLFRWTAEGLNALAGPCPAAAAVYEELGEGLRALLAEPAPAAAAVDALITEAAARRDALNAKLAAGRDRLLELGSQRPAEAAELVAEVEHQDRDPGLFEYLSGFWDAFGVEHEPGPGGATVLRPGKHMLQERFPGLPEDGLTVTFDRSHALAHEERAFLTWEHPLVHAAMDLLTGSDLGSSVVNLTRDERFSTGALLLDAVHIAECPAPPELQAGRFLPPTALRLLIDEQGRDRSDTIDPAQLIGKDLASNRRLARTLIEAKAQAITAMLAAGEPLVEAAATRLREEAINRMQVQLDAELERLEALARVNPAVRPEELTQLRDERERLAEALGHIRLRLDALRLIAFA